MITSVKKIVLAVALVMSFCCLQAQENPHARAMRKAFVMTRYSKYTDKSAQGWVDRTADSTNVYWRELDGGGLVPKEKIYFVELSKNSGHIGPLYLDGHRFYFNDVPNDSLLPLRMILDAYDKQAPYASTYYSYVAGDEQAAFPGVSVMFGPEGSTFPLKLEPEMNVRVISFKDDDGFRSTYLLSWVSHESKKSSSQQKFYDMDGIFYEFHCPKLSSAPQVSAYDSDTYLDRTNMALDVAHNLVRGIQKNNPKLTAELKTDTLMEKFPYTFSGMLVKLYKSPETPKNNVSYRALKAKLERMVELSKTANPTELLAICHTMDKETGEFEALLTNNQVKELNELVEKIAAVAPEYLKSQVKTAHSNINTRKNLTEDIDSLNEKDQEFLNWNGWKLSHGPVDYSKVAFVTKGEHYTGDPQVRYFHVKGNAVEGFHAEATIHSLAPGRYRLSAVVRAAELEHSGIHIFAKTGAGSTAKIYHQEIPAKGNIGGNVWFSALCRYEERVVAQQGVYGLDIHKATANGGQGFGWNRIYLDDIIVDGFSSLTYGISTRHDITGSYLYPSNWFSACDFILEPVE